MFLTAFAAFLSALMELTKWCCVTYTSSRQALTQIALCCFRFQECFPICPVLSPFYARDTVFQPCLTGLGYIEILIYISRHPQLFLPIQILLVTSIVL